MLFATGCLWNAPVPTARVQHGPAFGDKPATLVAMPVTCMASPDLCSSPHQLAIASATRMDLEYDGYTIVDSELVNAEMLRRHQLTGQADQVIAGRSWAEASPDERRELLHGMGVDGMLTTQITIGGARGMASQRTVAVELAVLRLDGQLVWWAQCRAETGDYNSTEEAMERATRCALASSALW
jgi:hypothetical protein